MIWNLKNLIELYTYLYCLAELFGKKFKLSIYAVVLLIFAMFLLVGINAYGFPMYFLSLLYIAMFLYGLLNYGESIKLTLVNCFLAYAVIAALQVLIFLPLYCLFFRKYEQGYMNELLINAGCLLVIMLCSHKVRLMRLSDFFIKRDKLIVGVSILILCGLGINFYQMKEEGVILTEVYIQMVYFILIFLFIIYEWQKSRVEAEKRKAQLEMNQLYYDAYDRLIMLIRERQHDMKSHINAILGMIYTTDNYDELAAKQREYCGYVIEQNEKTRLVLSTGNPLIAGFLYSKVQEAENNNIKVEYQIEINKETSVIPEYELVEMAAIMIDNAIEALNNTSEDVNNNDTVKGIYISMKETDEYVQVIVANTSDYYEDDITERFFEAGYSSKGKERGLGLSKLRRMVYERNGEIMVSNERRDERNYLTFTITLAKEKRQKS